MRDLARAGSLPAMAEKDFRALQGMGDTDVFADSIFSFHAQQAVEKALKAWCSLKGIPYPRTHDLERLFGLLEESGEELPSRFAALASLTDFAVQYRYESTEVGLGPIDRGELVS